MTHQEEPIGYDGFGAPIYQHDRPPPLEPTSHWLTIADIQAHLDALDGYANMLAEAMLAPYCDDGLPLCEKRVPERGQE